MEKTRNEIIEKIKRLRPNLSEEEAKQYLETLETYCELIINYTMKHGDLEEDDK
jgi:hypothetical protein